MITSRASRPDMFGSALESLQSYLLVCLVLSSLYVLIAAFMAYQVSAVAGIVGMWALLLDSRPKSGFKLRFAQALKVSVSSSKELARGAGPEFLRIGGAALILWALVLGGSLDGSSLHQPSQNDTISKSAVDR